MSQRQKKRSSSNHNYPLGERQWRLWRSNEKGMFAGDIMALEKGAAWWRSGACNRDSTWATSIQRGSPTLPVSETAQPHGFRLRCAVLEHMIPKRFETVFCFGALLKNWDFLGKFEKADLHNKKTFANASLGGRVASVRITC